ncbi:hypothetical protein WNY81_07820 [Shewanella frigidimarina]|uniref:hypothetical protein n=1 Tax=Shewanella frigidimarina TaxID=56812 RepID=UPI00316C3CA9
MSTFLGICLLMLPLIFFGIYSNHEFDLSLSDNLKKWKWGKYFAVILVLVYVVYLLMYGHSYVVMGAGETSTYLEDWVLYYLVPGLCLAAVIYSKPVGYFFGDNSSEFGLSIKEDVAFMLGLLWLLFFTWQIFLESL